jgi:hypothetical protein
MKDLKCLIKISKNQNKFLNAVYKEFMKSFPNPRQKSNLSNAII